MTVLVCEHLRSAYSIYNRPLRKHTTGSFLLSLALTCRAWQEVALDVLWRELCGLQPLIRVMPSDLWELRKGVGGGDVWTELHFVRAVQPSDWDRLLLYSRRIRRLYLPSTRRKPILANVSDDVFGALASSLPHNTQTNTPFTLLPNLHTLLWVTTSASALPFFPLLLNPSLTSLRIGLGHKSQSESGYALRAQVLQEIKRAAPALEVLQYNWTRVGEIKVMSDVVMGCGRLTDLYVSSLESEALRCIAGLPALRALQLTRVKDVELGQAFPKIDNATTGKEALFPALTNVVLTVQSMDFVLGLLEIHSNIWILKVLQITIRSKFTKPDSWHRLFSLLGGSSSSSSPGDGEEESQLTSLQITETLPPSPSSSPTLSQLAHLSLTPSTLTPLLTHPHPHLSTLEIRSSLDITPDDAFLHTLGSMCPKLSVLHFQSPPGYTGRRMPGVGVGALEGLVGGCPGLTRIAMVVDATKDGIERMRESSLADSPQHQHHHPAYRHSTQITLILYDSLITDPMSAASYLTGIFDDILTIKVGRPKVPSSPFGGYSTAGGGGGVVGNVEMDIEDEDEDEDEDDVDDPTPTPTPTPNANNANGGGNTGSGVSLVLRKRLWKTVMFLVPTMRAIREQERRDVWTPRGGGWGSGSEGEGEGEGSDGDAEGDGE